LQINNSAGLKPALLLLPLVYITYLSDALRPSIWPDWITGGFGSATSQVMGFFSSCFISVPPLVQSHICIYSVAAVTENM